MNYFYEIFNLISMMFCIKNIWWNCFKTHIFVFRFQNHLFLYYVHLKCLKWNYQIDFNDSPLQMAIMTQNQNIVKLLLSQPTIDVNQVDIFKLKTLLYNF